MIISILIFFLSVERSDNIGKEMRLFEACVKNPFWLCLAGVAGPGEHSWSQGGSPGGGREGGSIFRR